MKSIYLEDAYIQRFEAVVEGTNDDGVLLNQTAFYPRSGGQPSDTGELLHDGKSYPVTIAKIEGDVIWHETMPGLNVGDQVTGCIDWEKRYRFMRSHTACHIISAVIFEKTGAKITGNNIEYNRSRVDFNLKDFDREKMVEYVEMACEIVRQGRAVSTYILDRDEAMKIPDLLRLAMDVPNREKIRIVNIDGVDVQACGGTHVKNTKEIGGIRLVKAENKGKANRRVYFELEEMS